MKFLRRHEKLQNPQQLPATNVSWYAVVLTTYHLKASVIFLRWKYSGYSNVAIRQTERCICYHYCQDNKYFSVCIACLYKFLRDLKFPPALHTVNGLCVAKMIIILWLYPVVI